MKFSLSKINKIDAVTGLQNVVELNGMNLIVVGDNGSGKTQFLKKLYDFLITYCNSGGTYTEEYIKARIKESNERLSLTPKIDPSHLHLQQEIDAYEKMLSEYSKFNAYSENMPYISSAYKNKETSLLFFPADRYFQSTENITISSRDSIFKEYSRQYTSANSSYKFNHKFEQYIVSIWNYALLNKASGNLQESDNVELIINDITKDLQTLFEDPSLELVFNFNELRVEIKQSKKNVYTLDKLSSGYSSILAIYTELVMRAEFERIDKENLSGIVLIDEIDAHLHVSLQKKVFSFFTSSYPKIQFIISTHSPFVLQSVSNAMIYNLSNNETLSDLSVYSYTSIVKGLLGETGISVDVEKMLVELDNLSKKADFGSRYSEVITLLEKNYEFLDARSRAIVMGAKSQFISWEEGNENV